MTIPPTPNPAAKPTAGTFSTPSACCSRHEQSGPRRMIVRGSGSTVYDERWPRLHRRDGRPLVRQRRLRPPRARRRAARAGAAAALLPLVLVDGDRHAGAARRAASSTSRPSGMSKVLYGTSGSDANDTQIKLVRLYNNLLGRRRRRRSSRASAATTGSRSRREPDGVRRRCTPAFDLPIDGILHTTRALPAAGGAARRDRRRLRRPAGRRARRPDLAEGPETVAAFIAEPVQAAGGVIVPPDGYFPAIQEVLRRARRAADRRRGRLRLRPARHLVRQ